MERQTRNEASKKLHVAVMMSTGITIIISVSYTILSILGLVYRYKCDAGDVEAVGGADYFITTLYRNYIQSNECNNTLAWEDLTQEQSVFVLNILTLCASVLSCAAAIALLILIQSEDQQYLPLAAYVYIAVCCASQVVDITFATHFGMDYTYLNDQLNLSSPGLAMNYERDMLRLGAILLMAICMKGFATSAINCVLFGLIIFYIAQQKGTQKKEQHSIHKMGALSAYDQPRRQDPWQTESQMFYRGPQVNPAYVEDPMPPRSPRRELNVHTDYSRPEMWKNSGVGAARPFSYLEEPKRGPTSQAPSSPAGQWGRNGPPPPVPAPDYSPHTPRRLKPALKNYM